MAVESGKKEQASGPERDEVQEDHLFVMAREMAIEIFEQGRTKEGALELAARALRFADRVIEDFESREPLSEPLACKAGCCYCCFYQVYLTPLEAFLIFHHVDKTYSRQEKLDFMDRIEKTLERTEGKSLEERALTRRETPCIFLAKGRCSVYPVRPFVCRALHSLSGDACKKALESNSRLVEVEGYAHRYDIFMTVKAGVEQVCKDRGCQVDTLLMARAMKRCLEDPSLSEAWMKGRGVVPAGFVPA